MYKLETVHKLYREKYRHSFLCKFVYFKEDVYIFCIVLFYFEMCTVQISDTALQFGLRKLVYRFNSLTTAAGWHVFILCLLHHSVAVVLHHSLDHFVFPPRLFNMWRKERQCSTDVNSTTNRSCCILFMYVCSWLWCCAVSVWGFFCLRFVGSYLGCV